MRWPRSFLYAHCVVAVLCVALVAYGMSRHDAAWEFRLDVERLLADPGGWPMFYLLQLSCLAFPIAVLGTVPRRIAAWRFLALAVVDSTLSLVQYAALQTAFPIRE